MLAAGIHKGIGYTVQWSRVWLVSQDRIHEVSATGAVSDLSACAAAHQQKWWNNQPNGKTQPKNRTRGRVANVFVCLGGIIQIGTFTSWISCLSPFALVWKYTVTRYYLVCWNAQSNNFSIVTLLWLWFTFEIDGRSPGWDCFCPVFHQGSFPLWCHTDSHSAGWQMQEQLDLETTVALESSIFNVLTYSYTSFMFFVIDSVFTFLIKSHYHTDKSKSVNLSAFQMYLSEMWENAVY